MEKLGVEVLTHHRVAKLDKDHVYFADGTQIDADLKVWAAGIKAPFVLNALEGFEKDAIGRLKVYATLQTRSDPNIFAFGDCAHCQPAADEPVLGPRAQVARSNKRPFCFEPSKRAFVVSLCRCLNFLTKALWFPSVSIKLSVKLLGQVNVQGVLAKPCMFLYIDLHQATLHGYTQAGLMTAKDLMNKKVGPKVKLH